MLSKVMGFPATFIFQTFPPSNLSVLLHTGCFRRKRLVHRKGGTGGGGGGIAGPRRRRYIVKTSISDLGCNAPRVSLFSAETATTDEIHQAQHTMILAPWSQSLRGTILYLLPPLHAVLDSTPSPLPGSRPLRKLPPERLPQRRQPPWGRCRSRCK